MRHLVLAFSLLIASLTAQGQTGQPEAAAKSERTHSFFVAGPQFTGIIGEDGKVEFDTKQPAARDGFVLPNGNLLVAWSGAAAEFTRESKPVFHYEKSKDCQELGTIERLANGNTLITELGKKPALLEVDKDGKVVVTVPLQPETDNAHMQTRMARKLDNGNYLVPHLLAFAVKEYTPSGEVVHTIRTDLEELGGKKVDNWPFTAIRLPDGNTLVGLTHGDKVAEFDKDGKVVWSVSNDDLPGKPIHDACGVQRLPDGNTVIACYAAKSGIKIFEVNRAKQIVWSWSGSQNVHHFQILTTDGKPVPGKPLK